jgi:glycosyltransferase involved in cell wall biosynthesis
LAAFGTRRGTPGFPPEITRLLPAWGATAYLASRTIGGLRSESARFALNPWFDLWVSKQIRPGEHVVSSYGYANACFKLAVRTGGKTFLDAGNTHPAHFWEILSEEHRRWKYTRAPISKRHYERSLAMMEDVSFVLAPSNFVAQSFLARGFSPEQVLSTFYPIDFSIFTPRTEPRPKSRPLTVISTAGLSLRKGSPYLLDALRIVHRKHPSLRILLTSSVHENMRGILQRHSDLPIHWTPPLPHSKLAPHLQSADIFVLPSLEEGLVRSSLEAMACGLPVVLTPNTGASDYVASEAAGEVVPIRNPEAIASAILKIAERVMSSDEPPRRGFDPWLLSFARFEENFLRHLSRIGI